MNQHKDTDNIKRELTYSEAEGFEVSRMRKTGDNAAAFPMMETGDILGSEVKLALEENSPYRYLLRPDNTNQHENNDEEGFDSRGTALPFNLCMVAEKNSQEPSLEEKRRMVALAGNRQVTRLAFISDADIVGAYELLKTKCHNYVTLLKKKEEALYKRRKMDTELQNASIVVYHSLAFKISDAVDYDDSLETRSHLLKAPTFEALHLQHEAKMRADQEVSSEKAYHDLTISEKRKTIIALAGHSHLRQVACLSDGDMAAAYEVCHQQYNTFLEMLHLKQEAATTVLKLETTLQGFNKVSLDLQHLQKLKASALKSIYSAGEGESSILAATQAADQGGTYAHLTMLAIEKLFQVLKEKASFDRHSVFFDIGSGLLLPTIHAATAYCKAAAGIEIEPSRCIEACNVAIKYLNSSLCRNNRFGLLFGDVLSLQPVCFATHIFLFDLAFPPKMWCSIIQWLSRCRCTYVILFKPVRWPKTLSFVLEILQADVIDRVRKLKFSGCNESCTALILKRKTCDTFPSVFDSLRQDSYQALGPCLTNSKEKTGNYFKTLRASLEYQQIRSKVDKTDGCQCQDWIVCPQECAKCNAKFIQFPCHLLFYKKSDIKEKGLFARTSVPSESILLELGPTTDVVKNLDGYEPGLSTYVNHRQSPNARLQEITWRNGDKRVFVVTTIDVPQGTEITADIYDSHVHDPLCSKRRNVLFLGMVQYSHKELLQTLVNRGMRLSSPALTDDCLDFAMRTDIISQQHARDMLRISRVEATCNAEVYTADINGEAHRRHFVGSFASTRSQLVEHYAAAKVGFDQIVLDYCWIPPNWKEANWTAAFYQHTIPNFAKLDVLREGGEVVLPCDPYTLKMIALNFQQHMEPFYDIEFCSTDELERITLWEGTQAISEDVMLHYGKRRAQEEAYCRCTSMSLKRQAPVAWERFGGIQNLESMRFLLLVRKPKKSM